MVTLAWQTSYFTRQKRLPNLHTVLTPAKKIEGEEKQKRDTEFDDLVREMM